MAFVRVAPVTAIPPGSAARFDVNGRRVAVFHLAGVFYAIDDVCSHAEASLCEGEVDGCTVACPRHGARFDIATGRALTLPAVVAVDTFPVSVENGDLYLDMN